MKNQMKTYAFRTFVALVMVCIIALLQTCDSRDPLSPNYLPPQDETAHEWTQQDLDRITAASAHDGAEFVKWER
ncbi:MAG: hypothetical protein Q4G42_03580 [Neisseria sp.]|nr:hypothetical protein [Neisseria sp.]